MRALRRHSIAANSTAFEGTDAHGVKCCNMDADLRNSSGTLMMFDGYELSLV